MPLIIGSELEATRVANALREMGVLVPAIRFPTGGTRRCKAACHSDRYA